MTTNTLKLYSLSYSELKSYLLALAFVVGNILLPQVAHLVPQGGFIFLPIYFFTLVAGYKYGWQVGVMTAVFSPLANHLLFGMPPLAVLPAIMIKSIFLALSAAFAANYFKRISLGILALVIMSYQLFGTLIEWALVKEFMVAIQDFRMGIPGMLIQLFGGYAVIKHLLKR